MSRPDIVDKSKASSHPLRPGRFYTGKIKRVESDGRVTVSITELGLTVGPVMPLNQIQQVPLAVNEFVKCTFSDEFFKELIVFGRVTPASSPFVLTDEVITGPVGPTGPTGPTGIAIYESDQAIISAQVFS
jgi:hypothetical protein